MNSNYRTGIGFDAHQVGQERPCQLAGLTWPESARLVGHSDGDVAVHAICDAILSACQLGDLGDLFGVDQEQWKGASGLTMLNHLREYVTGLKFTIVNASVQIIGNEPKIRVRRDEAQRVLSEALEAPVSVSATTTDHLGFTGRGEGVAAIASALVIAP